MEVKLTIQLMPSVNESVWTFLFDFYVKIRGTFLIHMEGHCRNRTYFIGSLQINLSHWTRHKDTILDAEILFVSTVDMNFAISLSRFLLGVSIVRIFKAHHSAPEIFGQIKA